MSTQREILHSADPRFSTWKSHQTHDLSLGSFARAFSMSSLLGKFRSVTERTEQPLRVNPIFASPPWGIVMDFSNFPSSAKRSALPASRIATDFLVILPLSSRRIMPRDELRRGPARPARHRRLHDVGQVRQLRHLPDHREVPEASGQERLHLRV